MTIQRALRALYRPGDVVEVRAFDKNGGRFVSRYPYGGKELAAAIADHDEAGHDVYYVCNPTSLAPVVAATEGTKEKDVVRRRWVLLDFDPIRTYKIASDKQHLAALNLAKDVGEFFALTEDWGGIVLASSGNGVHLLIPVDLPVDPGAKQLVKNVQRTIADKFQTPEVEVECFPDANRLIRAYGTTNHKANETDTLKWRKSFVIEAAETPPAPITEEQLETFVAKYTTEVAKPDLFNPPGTEVAESVGQFTSERLREKLEAWSEQHPEFAFTRGRTAEGPGFHITCPGGFATGWRDGAAHSEAGPALNGSAAVWVGDGFPRFRCAHAHCDAGAKEGKKTWRHLQEFFETKLFLRGVAVKSGAEMAAAAATATTATPEDGSEPKTQREEYDKWVADNARIKFVGGLTKEKPKWVIDRMIFYGGVSMICAPQGGGKTLLAIAMARGITLPIAEKFQFLGRWIAQHLRVSMPKPMTGLIMHADYFYTAHEIPVLYIDRENPESVIAERITKMGLLACKSFHYWPDDEKNPTPEPDDPRVMAFARAGGLIIFDSLQDWYGGLNENDNSQMASLMRKFTRLARLGAGVIILHHTPAPKKDQPEKLWRGATAIIAASEMAIALTKAKEGDPPGTFHLSQIRFRPSTDWVLSFHLEWNDRRIKLSLVSDSNAAQMAAEKAKIRSDKVAAKKNEKATADFVMALDLEKLVKDDPTLSNTHLGEAMGISRNNPPKLLKLLGWRLKKGTWVQDKSQIKGHPGIVAVMDGPEDDAVGDDLGDFPG